MLSAIRLWALTTDLARSILKAEWKTGRSSTRRPMFKEAPMSWKKLTDIFGLNGSPNSTSDNLFVPKARTAAKVRADLPDFNFNLPKYEPTLPPT